MILLVMASIAVFGVIMTTPESLTTDLINKLSIGMLVSIIFYSIVVWFPAKQRKDRIKGNLQKHYNAFKLSCISIFLIYSNSQTYKPEEMLLDLDEFRRFFKINVTNDQTRWDVVANALEGGAYPLRDILNELEILRDELRYVLNNIDIHDEEVFAFMKRLSHHIFKIKHVEPGHDDIKALCQFLWEVFTGWSFIEGYRKEDIIQTKLDEI